ncbi:MAG: hypothetical protein ACRCSF_10585 [Mycobacteriaceae bacterium]
MQGLAVVLFPALLMLFALFMERVESQIDRVSVKEKDVEEFLTQASSAEVTTLASQGFPQALAIFRRRRKRETPVTTRISPSNGDLPTSQAS